MTIRRNVSLLFIIANFTIYLLFVEVTFVVVELRSELNFVD